MGLHCLPRPVCPKSLDHYGKFQDLQPKPFRKKDFLLRYIFLINGHVGHNEWALWPSMTL